MASITPKKECAQSGVGRDPILAPPVADSYSPKHPPEPQKRSTPIHTWGLLYRVGEFRKQLGRRTRELSAEKSPVKQPDQVPQMCLLRDSPYRLLKSQELSTEKGEGRQPELIPQMCLLREKSLYRVLKVAARGNVDEFVKVYTADPSRLNVQDQKGQRPLHAAAAEGHRDIVNFIIKQHADLDATDVAGDTALHLAVRHDHSQVVRTLLEGGADHSVLNGQLMAPLHLACHLGYVEVVTVLVEHPDVDRDMGGEHQMKPLHICSFHDHAECARILLMHGANACIKCNLGFFPIHVAAQYAAHNTLQILIEQGVKNGHDRFKLLTLRDKENNMPLHAAVNGGNIKVVEVCLQAGAPVDRQQDDKSTPVHFAAAQGNLDMIKLMHSMQESNFKAALYTCDAMHMTPLHRAAIFNHKAAVRFLLDKGADINSQEATERTPIMLAASKGCWETVQLLMERGADVRLRDRNSQNFLHLAISFGGKLGHFFCRRKDENDCLLYCQQRGENWPQEMSTTTKLWGTAEYLRRTLDLMTTCRLRV